MKPIKENDKEGTITKKDSIKEKEKEKKKIDFTKSIKITLKHILTE